MPELLRCGGGTGRHVNPWGNEMTFAAGAMVWCLIPVIIDPSKPEFHDGLVEGKVKQVREHTLVVDFVEGLANTSFLVPKAVDLRSVVIRKEYCDDGR